MINICSAKDDFIFRQSDIDERIVYFDENYETWISMLPEEVVEIVLSMLERFDYYSHKDANEMLKALHQKLFQICNYENSDILFTYIKKKGGKICSSIDYWVEYRFLNNIDKNFCTDDLASFPSDYWEYVEHIVIIDDCCGTGGSLEKFLKWTGKDFTGKIIYYLILHYLEASQEKIDKLENEYGVTINVLSINARKKASEMISGTNAQEIRERIRIASQKIDIQDEFILGKDDSEGLMAFYNNTPNNTIGLFWFETEKNSPVLPRKFGKKPIWDQMKTEKKRRKKSNYMAEKRNG